MELPCRVVEQEESRAVGVDLVQEVHVTTGEAE